MQFNGDILVTGLSGEFMGVHYVMLYNTCIHIQINHIHLSNIKYFKKE